jgi:hypothetical protein
MFQKMNLTCGIMILLLLSLGSLSWVSATPESSSGDGSFRVQNEPGVRVTSDYNDYAHYIAGLDSSTTSLQDYEKSPTWRRYAKSITQSWKNFEKRQLVPMKAWASEELAGITSPTIFYPFSGPDFVNIYNLFPKAKTYLMIALEPVGRLPDSANLGEQNFLAGLQRSLSDLLNFDFFITNKMANSLGVQELNGVLPVLMFFLGREQASVLDVRYWVMKPDGTIAEVPVKDGLNLAHGDIPGVRIEFTGPGDAAPQTLYYFRFNLNNNSMQQHQHFVSFLEKFGPVTTFAKAASYLMFKPHFSVIRQFILDRSLAVLQSDSAIPLKYFEPGAWNFRFYGTYKGPIALFKNCSQKELAEVYKKSQEISPLPFGIDYHHRLRTSNLMLASKKGPSADRGQN